MVKSIFLKNVKIERFYIKIGIKKGFNGMRKRVFVK